MEHVNVYQRGGDLFITPSSHTTAGIWLGTDPIIKLDRFASHEQVGDAILKAFSESNKETIPHPIDFDKPTSSLLKIAGVRSWSSFEKHANLISVEQDANELRIQPWWQAKGGGFGPAAGSDVVLSKNVSAKEIGAAIEETWQLCR